jgi:glycosyltransferase involved in cell wall biosynthesis
MTIVTDISVVIPTRNRSGCLGLALRSALRQRDVELEVLVVDDGSTDDTSNMVANLGEPRIRLIRREQSGGVSAARNQGAAEARGEWLAFLDDDDVWASEKLARQLAASRAAGRTWVYTGWVVVDHRLQVMSGRPPPPPDSVAKLLYRCNAIPTGGSNVIVRRDAFDQSGGFDPHLRNGEDWELWIRLTGQGLPAWVPEPLMAYRIHPANASLDVGAVWSAVDLIEQRHRTRIDRGSIERWLAESRFRTGQRGEAFTYLARAALHGRAPEVARDLVDALRRRVDRRLGLAPRRFPHTADASWTARAQGWLDELAAPISP